MKLKKTSPRAARIPRSKSHRQESLNSQVPILNSSAAPPPAGYSGTPLPKKLGIKPGATVLLVSAPAGFADTLGELPPGAKLARSSRSPVPTILLFVRSQATLAKAFEPATMKLSTPGALWIIWPKKSSPLAGDLGENEIRAFGLARGFVDYKVCAVDADWSGLVFARRRS
ncbi:MAG: DUF3052 domain-containing protein [Thermoanaerobaculia bacterium]|jgi:hypothetical protein